MSDSYARALELAAGQHGLISARQARKAGLSVRTLQRRLDRVLPGVYATEPGGDVQQMKAALLWAGTGAALSHRTAGRLYAFDGVVGVEHAPVEVIVPPGRYRRRCQVVTHRAEVPDSDVHDVNGLRVTRPARTLVDLSSSLPPLELAMAVEHAWRKKWVYPGWLRRWLTDEGTQGRPGASELRRIVGDCVSRARPFDSALEVKLWWYLKRSALPRPIPQCWHQDARGGPLRIDFAFPEHGIAVETNGFATHSRGYERDCERLTRLAIAGWRVLHFTWGQMFEPEKVLEQIGAALATGAPLARVPGARYGADARP